MRFLFDLFSNDPSKNWTKSGETRLTFHLAAESLNGAAIEDSFDKLSVFGRPANRNPFEKNLFDYPDLGLVIGGENNRIEYFSFSIQSFTKNSKPCEVTLISERGTPVLLNKNTKCSDVESVLGKPFEQEKDDDEAEYRYKYKRLILVFEFDEDELILFEAGLEDYV
jgi:hypothetical protein